MLRLGLVRHEANDSILNNTRGERQGGRNLGRPGSILRLYQYLVCRPLGGEQTARAAVSVSKAASTTEVSFYQEWNAQHRPVVVRYRTILLLLLANLYLTFG